MKKTTLLYFILILTVFLTACGSSAPAHTPTPKPTLTPFPSLTPIPTRTPIPTISVPEFRGSVKESLVYKDGLESDGKIHVYLVGSGEKVTAKNSKSIRSMTYYEESDHLIINFNGKEYVFANVSSSLWDSFKEASSSEAFYESHIKGNKSYWVNGYNGKNGGLIVMEYVGSNNQSSDSSYITYSSTNTSTSQASERSYVPDYAICEVCERVYSTAVMWDMGGGDYICENCLDGGDFAACERCGEIYHVDDMYYVGEYLCENCVEELSEEYYGEYDGEYEDW